MTRRRILLTGGTGFVGGALVQHLIASGVQAADLRLLVRHAGRARSAGLPHETLIEGCLADRGALERAAAGVDLVFHVAGAIRGLSSRDYHAVNADGTARLLDVLLVHAPDCRLIHVSSLAAAGPSIDGETSGLPPESCAPCSHYGESKRRGELHVLGVGDRLRWVIVRPPVVYGPGDAVTRMLFRSAMAPIVAVPWTRRPISLIHVDDLIRALRLAADSPVSRRILPVEGPDRLDTTTMIQSLAAAVGRRARLVHVPLAMAWPVAVAADLYGQLRGRPGIFGRDKLREVRARGWVADPTIARDAIDFVPRISTTVGFDATARAEGFS